MFGWDLPPGCSQSDIDAAFYGGHDVQICDECGAEFSSDHDCPADCAECGGPLADEGAHDECDAAQAMRDEIFAPGSISARIRDALWAAFGADKPVGCRTPDRAKALELARKLRATDTPNLTPTEKARACRANVRQYLRHLATFRG